jgi:hypothetical protein
VLADPSLSHCPQVISKRLVQSTELVRNSKRVLRAGPILGQVGKLPDYTPSLLCSLPSF